MAESEIRTNVGGLRAVELQYRAVREISGGRIAFYQSQTRLNAPQLGILMPEQFRAVSEMTNQALKLFYLEMSQVLEAVGKLTEREMDFKWISVYMPVRYLLERDAVKAATALCERYEIPTSRICFELPERLLTAEEPEIPNTIVNLRNVGFHIMLNGFGGSNCPLMRLSDYPVEYVMLSPEVTHFIGRSERADNAVKSIVDFVNDLEAEPIADGVRSSKEAETFYTFSCSYCAGSLAGKFMAERYIRKKQDVS